MAEVTDLRDASVLVVGASGGLGGPITTRLADAGARLTLAARDRGRLAAIAPHGAAIVAADLRAPSAAAEVVDGAVQAHGRLDGVVMAAGVVAFGGVDSIEEQTLAEVFAINAFAPMWLMRAAVAPLSASAAAGRDPFFVTISAVVAEQPTAGMGAYSASKAAASAFTTVAARELRRRRVRVVDVRPPHTETGLATRPIAGSPPPLPQGLSPDVVADRVLRAIVDGEREVPAAAFGG